MEYEEYNYELEYYNWTYWRGNWTQEEEKPDLIHNLVFDVVLLILTLVGNSTVLVVIINVAQKSRMSFYFINLAVADLLCGIFYIVPRIVRHCNDGRFYGGDTLCKLQEYLANVGIFGSITVMVALSLDRLHLLLRPFGSQRIYFHTIFVVVFIIPTMILMISYSVIAVIICRVSRRDTGIESTEIPSSNRRQLSLLSSRRNSHSSGSEQREPTLSKSQTKTIKMTFLIVVAYFCCWAPYMIVTLLVIHGLVHISTPVNIFINGLLPLNSVVNPLIYLAFSSRLLKKFRKKINRRLCTTRMT
ncbi:mesotocin receptor-like isoform X2 [Crassostrea angulata]|uniref:mesotocin receptor-like isoform X2 n=1 Tax=Magallana angulata TaxID=2784310 RepID=UPI0022B10BBA|nr:mesotocin receptor-like isoform X2 [Crassostrea angulata]